MGTLRILLVSPAADTRYCNVPPLGLIGLQTIARQKGCVVDLVDLSLHSHAEGFRKLLEVQYDVVGVSCGFTNSAPYCMAYGRAIREKYPDTWLLAGGQHATFVPDDLLDNGYDVVVCGEGERTFQALLECRLAGQPWMDLDGIAYRQDGHTVRRPPQALIENLDELPMLDPEAFDWTPYFRRAGTRTVSIMTSRGCVFNCAFCSTVGMWGRRFRQKSVECVVREFEIAKQMGADIVSIEDDDFALDEDWVRRFCLLIREKGLNLPWEATMGCRSVKDETTLDRMAESGCVMISVSVESASPRLLKAYKKVFTLEDNLRMCQALRRHGIMVHNKGIIGHPDETFSESVRTCLHLLKTGDVSHLSILEPRPGSQYWETWEKRGDVSQYLRFGKGNVFMTKRVVTTYLLMRLYGLIYLLAPRRMFRALFMRDAVRRSFYRRYYHMAFSTLAANVRDVLRLGRGGGEALVENR